MATIHELIPRIIGDLPAIGKTRENKDQGFMFRGIEDVLGALKPKLAQHGVFWTPTVLERIYEPRKVGQSGNRIMHTVHLRVRFTFYGPLGDSVTAEGWGEGTDMGDKATNKAMTGAEKYVIGQVFCIADDSADSDHSSPQDTRSDDRPVPEGFMNADEAVEAHQAVTAKIKGLADEIDREPFQAYRAEHGWPMTRELLDGLAKMADVAAHEHALRVEQADPTEGDQGPRPETPADADPEWYDGLHPANEQQPVESDTAAPQGTSLDAPTQQQTNRTRKTRA